MIGGGAFLLLNSGLTRPESAKQAEIPLAGFATILAFGFRANVQGRCCGTMAASGEKMNATVKRGSDSAEYG
jgi:hypothetical protein